MTQNESESLAALEHLMEEFFSHTVSNSRKHEIEVQLNSFSSQLDSWKLCVYFVTHTSSQYVSMYALTTIESVINRQWVSLEWEHRVQLKSALYNYLIEHDTTAPNFIRNKLVKLMVDIARFDWPHFYPEFFTNIIQLLQSQNGQLLGLIMLRTASEELMCPRPDLSSFRKEELTRLVQQHIPQVFQILTSILDSLASFRPDSKAITREALSTVQHLFSWANLIQIPVQMITTIFNFTNVSSYAQDDDDMCVLAMSTLNELLYRKCVPPGSQELFIQLYHHIVQLLRDISCPSTGKLDTLGPDFMEKLSELLSLLIEQHLWRLESEPGFSAVDFLGLLFQLSMQLPSVNCYLRCLAVWASFIKQIKPQNAQRYSEALLGLVIAVLNKMQFTCNMNQLKEISNDDQNDNNETEWQVFLKTSIEIIAMIAEFAPIETFTRVLAPWKTANDVFCMLENAVDIRNCSLKLEFSETVRLQCILKDLTSLTQTLARLSSIFLDPDSEYYQQASPIIDNLLMKLIQSASLATNARFYHLKMNDMKLVNDFTEVHGQILAALKTWWLWLNTNGEMKVKELNSLMDITVPILRSANHEPPKVTHGAAHLLLSITDTMFPPTLIVLPSVVELLQMCPTIKYPDKQCKEVVMCAFTNLLVKPWGELSQQDLQKRNQMIVQFFESITKDFKEINATTDARRVKDVVETVLPCLSSVVNYSKHFPLNSKKTLYSAIKSTIEQALIVLPIYCKYPNVNEHLLIFFLNVLGVLQQHMGVVLVKHAMEVFLDVAVSDQQRKDYSGLDKMLQIFQLVVEAPGNNYKNFLPGILSLCLDNVFPTLIVEANEQPDCIIALINLLHSILLHRWNYFYVSQIRLGNSPGCSDADPSPDSIQQPELLLKLLQVFGQSLLQPDINTFRTSLAALENLNGKWKLYHKGLFRDHLLSQFLTVLLQTLLDKSHNLLTDDILYALYNMSAVNFQGFFTTFLQQFLQNLEGLSAQQKDNLRNNFAQETDTPTFVHHLQRFINDTRCFRLCNSSLPAGSVVL
ncbi:PREDICTED: exportin-6-B isoform X2 [Nicrophorus vespilloides]|uniref:Exportin-6-B isoform X2 n=1 Tax=Nicrophorus vespilloides TaxID=110193 RepID=A0ABM1MMA4_NICVS|nr:PREDICTED: exportin-6-B isoform X2 [Nicrophorus vespilloides]